MQESLMDVVVQALELRNTIRLAKANTTPEKVKIGYIFRNLKYRKKQKFTVKVETD